MLELPNIRRVASGLDDDIATVLAYPEIRESLGPGFELGTLLEAWQADERHHPDRRIIVATDPSGDFTGAAKIANGVLSFFVAPRHQGRGHGLRIARIACAQAEEDLGLTSIRAIVLRENHRSRRIVDSLGFTFGGLESIEARAGNLAVLRYFLQLRALGE